jgi:phage-related holin
MNWITIKAHLWALTVAVAMVFSPVKSTLLTALSLVLLDFILGVSAAVKQKQPITSSGFKQTVVKILIYEGGIALAFLASNLTGPAIPLVNIVGSFIALTELKSCMENLNILGGGSILQAIIDRLNSQSPE